MIKDLHVLDASASPKDKGSIFFVTSIKFPVAVGYSCVIHKRTGIVL